MERSCLVLRQCWIARPVHTTVPTNIPDSYRAPEDMRVSYLFVLVVFLSSCAMAPTERPSEIECDAPRAFHVVSHGWHTGIIVNRMDLTQAVPSLEDDFGSGEYLEIGWGDERFYQARLLPWAWRFGQYSGPLRLFSISPRFRTGRDVTFHRAK